MADPTSSFERARALAAGTPGDPGTPPVGGSSGGGDLPPIVPGEHLEAPVPSEPKKTVPQAALLLLALLIAVLAGLGGYFAGQGHNNSTSVSVATPPVAVASAPATYEVDPTRNGGKLILGDICTLHSDGTSLTIQSQIAYKEAQDAYQKHRITEKMLLAAAEAAKPRPPHEVIAEIPASMLADGVTCNDWRRTRAAQLTIGVKKPHS